MAKGKINHWIDRFNRLDDFGKIAVLSTVLIVLILILVMFKQGTFLIGRTGSSGMFMPFLHHSNPHNLLMRCFVSAMSFLGAFCVFLMKPWSKMMRSSPVQKTTLAIFPGRTVRISHKPSPRLRTRGMPRGQPH